ncbi:alginate lyase family protein [Polaribacter glomeratus]|nr:alginate lyase family protein [Polaribacter glomeratus]TXD64965.1 hypothetical protein ESX12_12545 [Polaribacter glomeratus]
MLNKKHLLIFVFMTISSLTICQKKLPLSNNLFENLNLDSPSMKQVKTSYVTNKKPLKALLKFYREKEDLYNRVTKEEISYLREQYPEDIANSIKIADQVVNQYFVFREDWDMEKTNIPYQFGKEIDWAINPFGDPEWTYMLNRHKFYTHLAKAYFFTGKEKYAKTFVTQIEHWIENNPLPNLEDVYNASAGWRRIEAGVRCENWIKSFEYIKNSKHITPQFLEKFLNSLHLHGEYITNNYSDFSKTSNWGVLENQGLFQVSIFLKEFKLAATWQQDAIQKLTECIDLQIVEGGAHWEHSPMYHNEVMHSLMNVKFLADRNSIKLTEVLINKTKEMAYANVAWQKPNYHQPLLGDSDDTNTQGLLSLATYLYSDGVIKSRAHKTLDLENYLILGKEGNDKYQKIKAQDPDFLSVYQQGNGDFYMRSSWKEDATYTSLHLRKLAAGHAHDDLLSFTIFANGKDYLVDNGRYTYVNNKWRNFFKSNISHNSLGVDELPNSILKGAWGTSYEAWSKDIYTKSAISFDYGEAENTAYERLDDPVTMKRRMLYLKPDVWLIFDSFSAKESHKYSQYFNFPNKKVKITDGVISTDYENKNLIIQPIDKVEMKLSDSWYSSEYNLKEESKRGEIFKNGTGFTSMISLIHFSDENDLRFKKIPVYNKKGVLVPDSHAEAVTLFLDGKEYTLVVAYKSPDLYSHFFKVLDDIMVHGEIVLIEKEGDTVKTTVIK